MPIAPYDLFCWFWHNIYPLFYPEAERSSAVKGCTAPAQEEVRTLISCRLLIIFVLILYFDFFTFTLILPLLMYPFTASRPMFPPSLGLFEYCMEQPPISSLQ